MKRAITYVIITFGLFTTCRAQIIESEGMHGTFYKLNKDKYFNSSYTLDLRPDSSFTFLIMVKDAKPQCNGKWERDNEYILLKCNESSDPYEMLSNDYMSQKEHRLQIINKNKLKYKNLVLKRKK